MSFKAEAPVTPVQFAHGHGTDCVIVVVRRQGKEDEQFTFSPEQAEGFINGMRQSIDALKALQAAQAQGTH